MLIPNGDKMTFVAFFEDSDGIAQAGLTITIDVSKIPVGITGHAEAVTAGSMTEIRDGLYAYEFTSTGLALYVGTAKEAAATAARQNVPCAVLPHGMKSVLDTAAADVAGLDGDAMRGTEGASTHTAADIWAVGTRSLTTFGTLVADVWAAVSRTLTALPTGSATETKQDAMAGSGFVTGTDSLEAIRNRGDSAWITGGSPPITDGVTITQASIGTDGLALGQVMPFGIVTVYLSSEVKYQFTADGDGDYSYELPEGSVWTLVARAANYETTTAEVSTVT